jgi:hypothetical protein
MCELQLTSAPTNPQATNPTRSYFQVFFVMGLSDTMKVRETLNGAAVRG